MPAMRRLLLCTVLLAGLAAAPRAQQPTLVLSQLTWYTRTGAAAGKVGPLADHRNIELLPDGARVASAVLDRAVGTRDVWIYGPGAAATRLTTSPTDDNWMAFSADGMRAVVNAFGPTGFALFERPVGGTAPARQLVEDAVARWPVSWSPDGRFLLYVSNDRRTGNDIWVLPLTGSQPPYPFRATVASENWATFSPDGRFVAYSSTASGQPTVYVTPFPGPGLDTQISPDAGTQARWRRMNEIVYVDGARTLQAAAVRVTVQGVRVDDVTPLFAIDPPYGSQHGFDVTADGQRFMVNTTVVGASAPANNASLAPHSRSRAHASE